MNSYKFARFINNLSAITNRKRALALVMDVRDMNVSELVVDGRLDVESGLANPAKGQGRSILSDSGVEWQVVRLITPRSDSGRWNEIHTFAREGNLFQIAWLKEFDTFTQSIMASMRFRAQQGGAERAIAVARAPCPHRIGVSSG